MQVGGARATLFLERKYLGDRHRDQLDSLVAALGRAVDDEKVSIEALRRGGARLGSARGMMLLFATPTRPKVLTTIVTTPPGSKTLAFTTSPMSISSTLKASSATSSYLYGPTAGKEMGEESGSLNRATPYIIVTCVAVAAAVLLFLQRRRSRTLLRQLIVEVNPGDEASVPKLANPPISVRGAWGQAHNDADVDASRVSYLSVPPGAGSDGPEIPGFASYLSVPPGDDDFDAADGASYLSVPPRCDDSISSSSMNRPSAQRRGSLASGAPKRRAGIQRAGMSPHHLGVSYLSLGDDAGCYDDSRADGSGNIITTSRVDDATVPPSSHGCDETRWNKAITGSPVQTSSPVLSISRINAGDHEDSFV